MSRAAAALSRSLEVLRRDRALLLLGLLPVAIGAALYLWAGWWFYGDLLRWLQGLLAPFADGGRWGVLVGWVLRGALAVAAYLLLSWTFVLTVSLIASPFHDAISARAERAVLGDGAAGDGGSLAGLPRRALRAVLNEAKKMAIILTLSLVSLGLSLFPILAPAGLVLSALLLAAGFVDYSWARHGYGPRRCLRDLWDNLVPYSLAGSAGLVAIAVPVANVLALPFAVVYFTVLFAEGRGRAEGHKVPRGPAA